MAFSDRFKKGLKNVNRMGLDQLNSKMNKTMAGAGQKRPAAKPNTFHVVAGGYILYMAYQLFVGAIGGEAGSRMGMFFGLLASAAFLAAGSWILWKQYQAYKYGKEHMDDPETWLDEETNAAEQEEDQNS